MTEKAEKVPAGSTLIEHPGGAWTHLFTDARVYSDRMVVTRHMETWSRRRGRRTTTVFERVFEWGQDWPLDNDELQKLVEERLASMGFQAVDGWYFLDRGGWQHGCEKPDHWYSVVDRIPGSTRGWRD